MKISLQSNCILSFTIVFMLSFFLYSCNESNKQKVITVLNENNKTDIYIDFKLIAYLNDSNAKVIEVASKSFLQNKNFNQLKVINKIKKTHIKIEKDLIKIAERNLIIIPKPIYNLKLNQVSLDNQSENFYLLNILENSIQNEINILENIEKSTQNISIKVFAIKSKELLIKNKILLNNIIA